jgi:ferritin-like metal-binding protein YciE
MEEEPKKPKSTKKIQLGPESIKEFFVSHLNKIYSAKSHLVTKFPEIADDVEYKDLHDAMLDTINDVEKQMARMELILTLLDSTIKEESYNGIEGLVKEAFNSIKIHRQNHELRDLAIVYYLQNIESLEMASFQVLQMAAVKLKSKQIKQLLKENYEEAKADRTLMLFIATKYLTAD